MPYVNVPTDLSKIKTKIAFNLTKRQLICFGAAAVVGIPTFLLARNALGGTAAMLLMVALMLPAFLIAMYQRDGLPFEKVLRNILRSRFFWPRTRPYKTDNFYSYLCNDADESIVTPSESRGAHGGTGPAREVRRDRREPVTAAAVARTRKEASEIAPKKTATTRRRQ